MPKEFSRTRRVGEQIKRQLAVLIQQEIREPRTGMITVSAVDVAPDLSHAKVYITTLGDEEGQRLAVKALNQAAGFLRSGLARRLALRTVPQLRFQYDQSLTHGNRLAALIDAAVADDHKGHH